MSAPRTVVVGSGSCGGIVASRLSADPAHEVVLIEAGPDYGPESNWPPELRQARNPQLTSHDWGYDAHMVESAERRDPYPRGRVLGGSSVVNGVVGQRGTPWDYDGWEAAAGGGPGWDWASVLDAFKRLETDLVASGDEHGSDGPIAVTRVPRESWPILFERIAERALRRGMPWHGDHNSGDATGVGPVPRNERDGQRASTAASYLEAARGRPNLRIVAGASVACVRFDAGRAVGVELDAGSGPETIEADRVVLSAGVVGTPLILWRSGVGAADDLAALGIPVVSERPGVGRNLVDHPRIPLVVPRPAAADGAKGIMAAIRWTSPDAAGPNDLAIFLSVLDGQAVGRPEVAEAAMLSCSLMRPQSRGWIRPRARGGGLAPDIHLNFLAQQADRERLRAIVELAWDLATEAGVEPADTDGGLPDASVRADPDALDRWILERVRTGYHGVGTCRMGPAADDGAVVDGWLAVHGVEGLHVVDASVMPAIPAAPTNLTCYAIAEHAATWLAPADVVR